MSVQTVYVVTCDNCRHANGCDGEQKSVFTFIAQLMNEGWLFTSDNGFGQRHTCPLCVKRGIR